MRLATILTLMLAAASPAIAHHTYVTKYNSSKKISVSGTVTNVSYQNPHITFGLDAGGNSWTVETESISVARSSGLTEKILVAGANATITGWPARDGAAEIGLATIRIGGKMISLRRTAR